MTPTAEQVTRFASELHTRHDRIPRMKARIDRGAALALAGDVRPTRDGYLVLSSANDGTGYPVADNGRCCCPDAHHGAPVVRGVPICKHNIAYQIHLRALAENLAARILAADATGRQTQHIHPNTYLLIMPPSRGEKPALWSDRLGILARVTWSRHVSAWIPATPTDKIAVEQWLDNAAPLPTSNALDDLAIASTIEHYEQIHADDPTMHPRVFRRWLETGELPAYQQLDQALTH